MADAPLPREKITIIIPCHDEALYLGKMLRSVMKIRREMAPGNYRIQDVLVVDDGSTDATAKIGKRLGATVLSLGKNFGKTYAFYRGALEAKANGSHALVMLDADLQPISRDQLDKLVEPVIRREAQMTIGNVHDDSLEISGQRAIRLNTLEPLFRHTKKWEQYFGLRRGKFIHRAGFGLENALNWLIPRWIENRFRIPEVVRVVFTNFDTQRGWGIKKTIGGRDRKPELTIANYLAGQKKEMGYANRIHSARAGRAKMYRFLREARDRDPVSFERMARRIKNRRRNWK